MKHIITKAQEKVRGVIQRITTFATKGFYDITTRLMTVTAEPEKGAATAEYAVVMIAATGFAALLIVILKSDTVKNLLTSIVKQALNMGS